jgi:hypothetical protein
MLVTCPFASFFSVPCLFRTLMWRPLTQHTLYIHVYIYIYALKSPVILVYSGKDGYCPFACLWVHVKSPVCHTRQSTIEDHKGNLCSAASRHQAFTP